MHTSTSKPSSSTSSSPSSISLGSVVQYAVLGCVAYFLAGAPALSSFVPSTSSSSHYSGAATASSGKTNHVLNSDSLVIPEANLTCQEHAYNGVYVLSREPLVIYIEGFLSGHEAAEVVKASEPHFTPSTVWTQGKESLDKTIRHSEKAPLPRDQTVKCIEDRARRFQGWRPNVSIEKLWSQRYRVGGHYTYHYDWSTATETSGRVSSFMVYLEANCTGGGTHFPRLQRPSGDEWCKFIECEPEKEALVSSEQRKNDANLKEGVIFKPIAGNAVFWENMRSDGTGYLESWHAGLPVKSGVKIGLNIWSWFQAN